VSLTKNSFGKYFESDDTSTVIINLMKSNNFTWSLVLGSRAHWHFKLKRPLSQNKFWST
jgi:hypothetical protein